MKLQIDAQRFRTAVRDISAENPDYVYNPRQDSTSKRSRSACRYHTSTRPDGSRCRCIIGEALHRCGLSELRLRFMGQATPAGDLLQNLGIRDETAGWAELVQFYQDSGMSWDDAVTRADDTYRAIAAQDDLGTWLPLAA